MTFLYHYTCEHGRAALGGVGTLLPLAERVPTFRERLTEEELPLAFLIWATDLALPDRWALGLTMATIHCDRTQFRYRVVDPAPFFPWVAVRKHMANAYLRSGLERRGAMPMHWFVTTEPVAVAFDPL